MEDVGRRSPTQIVAGDLVPKIHEDGGEPFNGALSGGRAHDRGDHGLQDDAGMMADGDEAQHLGRRQRTSHQSQRPLEHSR